jgi:glyoxylase-like metal-dependent hydrolase (beta-lactamase superfamily II)
VFFIITSKNVLSIKILSYKKKKYLTYYKYACTIGLMERIYSGNMVEIYQISPAIYLRQANLPVRGQCNSVFLVGENSIALVDPSTADAAEEIREECGTLFGKPIRYLFLTHNHLDHALGLPVFARDPLTVFCSHRCAEEITDKVEIPAVVGVRGRLKLWMDRIKIELESLEDTAHSWTDMLVRFPAEKMVCTGDLVPEFHNMYFHHSNPVRWLANLRELENAGDSFLLPGHGTKMAYSMVHEAADYLEVLIRAAEYLVSISPVDETPPHIALVRKQAGPNAPKGLLRDLDDAALNCLVSDYLESGTEEARIIKEKGRGEAQRELRSVTRILRGLRMA